MGNTDSVPTTYSADDPTQMQKNEWLQTYKHDPYAHTNRIPWGTKGSHLSIGVKVLQDMTNNQLYVTTPQGQKIYITKDGKQLPNAAELITHGANYGLGPLLEIVGPPTSPEYYMWSGDQFSKGDTYQAVKINSLSDVQYAMTRKTDNTYDDTKHSGQYGEASIAGPFQNRPHDFWTGVAAAERTVADIGLQLIVPLMADVIGTVIPGFSIVAQATGLTNALTNALDTAQSNYQKSIQHQSASNFDTSLANVITDPRLTQYYESAHSGFTHLAHQTKTHDPNILSMPNTTPEQRILKARALETKTGDMQADQNAIALESMMAQVKIKYPNLNWGYYDQMASGLAVAGTAEQKLNILQHFSDKLVSDVTAVQDKKDTAQATDEASALESNMAELKLKYPKLNWGYYDQLQSGLAAASTGDQKLNILQHFSDKLSAEIEAKNQPALPPKRSLTETQLESQMQSAKLKYPKLNWGFYNQMQGGLASAGTEEQKQNIINFFSKKLTADIQATQPAAPTPQAVGSSPGPPPKGAGFGPVSWNPLVINGTYKHGFQQVVIRG